MQAEESLTKLVYDIMGYYHAPGIALSVINKQGDVLYEKFFGYRDEEMLLPVTENTIFGMASLSKSFTCLAIMQMHERKLIDINHPVSEYLPEFQDHEVRVSHLLEHTAGFYPLARMQLREIAEELHIYNNGEAELAYSIELADAGRKRVVDRLNHINNSDRLGAPGHWMSYCNDGYGLLSEIIRLYSGENTFPEYLEKYIMKPLGMTRSACEFVSPFSDPDHTSLYINIDGQHTKLNSFYHNAFVLHGGGAVRSTIKDMKKYLKMLMNYGDGIIQKATFSMVTAPGPESDYHARYCKALEITRIHGKTIYRHDGGLTGISNRMLWSPELGIGVLAFCNKTGAPSGTIADSALRSIGFGDIVTTFSPSKSSYYDALPDCDDILGTYRSQEGAYCCIRKDKNGFLVLDTASEENCPVTITKDGALLHATPYAKTYYIPVKLENGRRGLRFSSRIVPKATE